MSFLSWLFGNSPKPVPSAEADPARYNGRPLLMIMENYVLDCIGELPQDKQEAMRMVVQKAFGGGADWKKTVRQQVDLKDTVDDSIRQMWENNKRIARENNTVLHPVQFAKMFADENFGNI